MHKYVYTNLTRMYENSSIYINVLVLMDSIDVGDASHNSASYNWLHQNYKSYRLHILYTIFQAYKGSSLKKSSKSG